ncbi:unnamed protein product [Closterium sp. NIES-64]|nr:unnamed protein product [Closterium sp. NIES-64]
MPVPSSRVSYRYSGQPPCPSDQTRNTTQTDSAAAEEEDDEEKGEEGEGGEEDSEGSGDDSEPGWTPETHGGGGADGGGDEDEEMEGLEPEGVEEGVGEGGGFAAATAEEASQHVGRGRPRGGVKVGQKRPLIGTRKKKAEKARTRAYPCTFRGVDLGEGVLPGETFPRGGYVGVPDGYVYYWPHAEKWPNIPKKGGRAEGRGAEGSGVAGIKTYMSKKLSEVELRQTIAKLVVTCDLPFKIVEAEAVTHAFCVPSQPSLQFRELLTLCNQHCGDKNFIPSRWTVARDIVAYAAAALSAAKAELQGKEGDLGCKVSITIDIWTAPNGKAWLVVTGHWIDESFQLREAVLEFRELTGRHGAVQIAQVVEDTVVRCISHVVNLAVQAGLKVNAVGLLLKVLRDMASWVGFSPQRSAAFLGLQRSLNMQARVKKPALKLVQDSPTRWGSTHAMIDRYLELHHPITVHVHNNHAPLMPRPTTHYPKQGMSKTDKDKVEKMRLSDEKWDMLKELRTFLSPFNKVSKAAEGTAYPTLSMVVPYYNGLIDAMEARLTKGLSALLNPLVEKAPRILKKYEYISSNEGWIATFLDPSMKAAWFDDPHWETQHPQMARRERPRPPSSVVISLVRDRVAEYQEAARELAPRPTTLPTVVEEEEGEQGGEDEDDLYLPSRRRLVARLSASQAAGGGGLVEHDEVSRYLSERVRYDVSALDYWRTSTNMETLKRMARDYLAIPATSAASERVFSLGRNLISWKRHRLNTKRSRACMILRSWYGSHPGQRISEGRRPKL